ncbi:hypothetical protein HDU96_001411 [Phlyctochytrium bullatum]|nr:hypothetical protein HDU96_001411 [Phlyctochytrium bullatum]
MHALLLLLVLPVAFAQPSPDPPASVPSDSPAAPPSTFIPADAAPAPHCQLIAQYTLCATATRTRAAACNDLVRASTPLARPGGGGANVLPATPGIEYYECLCAAMTETIKCYALCPDDPAMQLQRKDEEGRMSASCKAVGDLHLQGYSNPTTGVSANADTTARVAASRTATTVPKVVFSKDRAETDGAERNAVGWALAVAVVVGVLFA